MLTLISFTICPFVQRVTAALEARNIPYEVKYISLSDKPDWFLEISPHGQVPVMVTESGTALFESDAIVEYIDDEYGALESDLTNEEKALDRAWSYLAAKNYLPQCGAMSSKNKQTFTERAAKLEAAFGKAEKQLSGNSRFFKSDRLSKVDIAWLPLLHRAAIVKAHSGYDFLCGMPKMQAWQAALMESGLAAKTVSDEFETRFRDFYLTNTYLAEGKDIQRTDCSSSNCRG